jgi:hypothetical protein
MLNVYMPSRCTKELADFIKKEDNIIKFGLLNKGKQLNNVIKPLN